MHSTSTTLPRQPLRAAAGVGVSTRKLASVAMPSSRVLGVGPAANAQVYRDFSGVESDEDELGDKKMMDEAAKRRAAKLKEIAKKSKSRRRSSSASDSSASERRPSAGTSDEEAVIAEERRARVSANSTWKTDVAVGSGARSRRASIGGPTMECVSTRKLAVASAGMGASVRRFSVTGAAPLQAATAQGSIRASTRNLIGGVPSTPAGGGFASPLGGLTVGPHTPGQATEDPAAARRAMLAAAGGTRGSVRMLGTVGSPPSPVPAPFPQAQAVQGYCTPQLQPSPAEATRRPSLAPSNAMLATMNGGMRSSTRYLGPSPAAGHTPGAATVQMGGGPHSHVLAQAVSPGFQTPGQAESHNTRPVSLAAMSGGARASMRMLAPAGGTPVTPVPTPVPVSPAPSAVSTSAATRRPSLAGGQAAAFAAANGGMRASTRMLGAPMSASSNASPHTPGHGPIGLNSSRPQEQSSSLVPIQLPAQAGPAGDGYQGQAQLQAPMHDVRRPSLAAANGGMRASVRGMPLAISSPATAAVPVTPVPAPTPVPHLQEYRPQPQAQHGDQYHTAPSPVPQQADRMRRPSLAGHTQGGLVSDQTSAHMQVQQAQPQIQVQAPPVPAQAYAPVQASPARAALSPRLVQATSPLSAGRGRGWDTAPHVEPEVVHPGQHVEAQRRPSLASAQAGMRASTRFVTAQAPVQVQQRRPSMAPPAEANPYAEPGRVSPTPSVHSNLDQYKAPMMTGGQHGGHIGGAAAGMGRSIRGPNAFASANSFQSTPSSVSMATPHVPVATPTPRLVHSQALASPSSARPKSPWDEEAPAASHQQHVQPVEPVVQAYHPRPRAARAAPVKHHDSPASTSIDEPDSGRGLQSEYAEGDDRNDGPPPLNGAEYRQGVYVETMRCRADGTWPDAEPAFIVVPMTRPGGTVIATVAGPNGEPVPVELDRKGRVCLYGDGSMVPWTDPATVKATRVSESEQAENGQRPVSKALPALPLFTALQMGAWVALFVLMLYMNSPGLMAAAIENPALGPSVDTLLGCGAKSASLVTGPAKEWWRLVTPLWINGGLVQLVPSLLVLWWVGTTMEVSLGTLPFAALYLGIGVFSVAFSTALATAPGGAAASGPICGLLIAMMPQWLYRIRVQQGPVSWLHVLLWCLALALFLAEGILPFIDNAAHVGGMIAGLLLGIAVTAQTGLSALWAARMTAAPMEPAEGGQQVDTKEAVSVKSRRLCGVSVAAVILYLLCLGLALLSIAMRWDAAATCPACHVFECLEFEGGWACPRGVSSTAAVGAGNTTAAA